MSPLAVRRADPEAGFTLIEALVAMAVLATGAVGLITAVERYTLSTSALTDRSVARWVAQYRLAEASLGLEPAQEPLEMMGQSWQTTLRRSSTADPDLDRLDISVAASGAREGGGRFVLSGFVAAYPETKEPEG